MGNELLTLPVAGGFHAAAGAGIAVITLAGPAQTRHLI